MTDQGPLSEEALTRRKILETLQKRSDPNPFVSDDLLRTGTGLSLNFVRQQLDILEHEGRVQLIRTNSGNIAKLTPLGAKSLEYPEEQFHRGSGSVHHHTALTVTNSQIGNVAQVTGSERTSISQTNDNLHEIGSILDKILVVIKNSPAVPEAMKTDSEKEIAQLKLELEKSTPNKNRIKEAIEWFKNVDNLVTLGISLAQLIQRLSPYLPAMPVVGS